MEALGLTLGLGSFPCNSTIHLKANKCPWGYCVLNLDWLHIRIPWASDDCGPWAPGHEGLIQWVWVGPGISSPNEPYAQPGWMLAQGGLLRVPSMYCSGSHLRSACFPF